MPPGNASWLNLVDGAKMDTSSGHVIHVNGATQPDLALVDRSILPGSSGAFRCEVSVECDSVTTDIASLSRCPSDFNCDGAVTSQDFFDFLAAFFGSDIAADFNADGAVNSMDFFDFLTAFFAGC